MIWQQNSKALLQRKGLWQIINPGVANDTTENGIKCIGYIKKDLDECGMDLIQATKRLNCRKEGTTNQ